MYLIGIPTTDITGVDVQPNIPLNQIELLSQNGNDLYGNSIQRTLAYSASVSAYFPGNQEPIDTTWPQQRLAWSVEPGDEIRFENNESENL